jgi:hypothetical protein
MPPVEPLVQEELVYLREEATGTRQESTAASWNLTLAIRPEVVLRVLGGIIGFLLLGHIAMGFLKQQFGITYLFGLLATFNLLQENNLPTFYSSFAMFTCSLLLAIVARAARTNDRKYFLHWVALSVAFAFLSYDEFVQMHEKMAVYLDMFAGEGFFRYAWVIPYGIAAALFGLASIPFLLHLPRPIARLFLASGAIYVMGAIGMEVVAARSTPCTSAA